MTDEEKDAALRAEISAQVFDDQPAAKAPELQTPELKSEVAPELPAEVKPEPEVQDPVDEWAGVSPALRARFEQLSAGLGEVETVKARLQQAERRVGALTNELHEAKKKPEPKEPPAENEKAKKFREDYAELSDGVEGTIEERIAAVRAELLEKAPTIDEKTLAETIAKTVMEQITFDLAVGEVEKAHPKWQQTTATPEFRSWQKTASPEVQALAKSARAADAITMLNEYAEFKKSQKSPAEIEAARLKRLEQAQTTQGRKLPVAKSESDMTPAELRAHIAGQVFGKT